MKGVLSLLLLSAFLTGAATSQRVQESEQPVLKLTREKVSADVKDCRATKIEEVQKGRVPQGAEVMSRLSLKGQTPLPLEVFIEGFREKAVSDCATHVSIIKAVASSGAQGYLEAEAVAWRWPLAS